MSDVKHTPGDWEGGVLRIAVHAKIKGGLGIHRHQSVRGPVWRISHAVTGYAVPEADYDDFGTALAVAEGILDRFDPESITDVSDREGLKAFSAAYKEARAAISSAEGKE